MQREIDAEAEEYINRVYFEKQNSKIYNYGKNGIVKTTRGGNNAKSNKSSGKMDSEQRTYSIPSSSKAPPPPKPKK